MSIRHNLATDFLVQIAILTQVRWNLRIILFVFPWWSSMLYILFRFTGHVYFIFWELPVYFISPFINLVVGECLDGWHFVFRVLYILCVLILCQMYSSKDLLHLVGCLFTQLLFPLLCRRFLFSYNSIRHFFESFPELLESFSESPCFCLLCLNIFPIFSSNSFRLLCFWYALNWFCTSWKISV